MRDSYDRFFKNFKISSALEAVKIKAINNKVSDVKFKKFEHIVIEELSKINMNICE